MVPKCNLTQLPLFKAAAFFMPANNGYVYMI